ncbi:hypothetical protein NMG60_11032844 [Bertholletia excelsa]
MEEEKGVAGGGEQARASSLCVTVGDRQRFTVELTPGQTTIVSWKKLVKDSNKVGPSSVPEPPSNAHTVLESRLVPGASDENEAKDAPPGSRFSAVIEKIERLYMGKHSSDEEDLNDVPDDDEYDTEDSFIDDAELDEYFEVDNSAIKHDGFFVNRGKLERINEPTLLPSQQPRKRRRKDLAKGLGEGDAGHMPNKQVKVGKRAHGKSGPLVEKNSAIPPPVVALPSIHHEDMKIQNQMNSALIASKKKSDERRSTLDLPLTSKVLNGDCSLSITEEKDIEMQKAGLASSKHQGNKLKDGVEYSDASVQRSYDRSPYAQCVSQSGKSTTNVDVLNQPVQRKEKDGTQERPDLNISEGKYSMHNKTLLVQRKEGSTVRPKSTMLDKTFKELEKMVAESRPPTMEAQDPDISSQAVKRRLPREIKQKIAKIARLAQASHGRITKELVNRLYSIVGHMIQLRTLKRNLKIMVNMGLSAKKEKDDRFQQMKKEVAELIRMRAPYIKSKALEQQSGASDDLQEIGNEEKEVVKKKYSMDAALEDKICDLYDLFVEGLDEDAGPHARKLYAELAGLWPDGYMDNHGIKRAICRAKDRKRLQYSRHKDQEKIKRKKLLAPRAEAAVRVETSSIAQPQYTPEKVVGIADSGNHGLTSISRQVPIATTANSTVRLPNAATNGPNLERLKQEKVKGDSSSNANDLRPVDMLTKKKVKRKPELELAEAPIRPEKLASAQGEERHKSSHKQVAVPLQKPSLSLGVPPSNYEQPS